MLRELLVTAVDLILPPRRSELLVRTLTTEHLQALGGEDGLPYHEPEVQALVWELKYRAQRRAQHLAGAYLAETLLAIAAEELGVPLLVPVPMHATRRKQRGHNQTELLCKATLKALEKGAVGVTFSALTVPVSVGPALRLSKVTPTAPRAALQYAPNALQRIVDTKTQQGLPRAVRLKNVKNSMLADERLVSGRVCVVVDDVTTTGATLAEATRALKAAGAARVHTVALARS